MGFLDKLTGTRRPDADAPVASAADVRAALLAVGEGDQPFVVREATADEQGDLVAEWRITEPEWRTVFERQNVERLVIVHLRLRDDEHEVRALDRAVTVTWEEGVASLSYSKEWQRGQVNEKAWRGTLDGDGLHTEWSFSTDELKDPLRAAVTGAGWTYKGVTFGKL